MSVCLVIMYLLAKQKRITLKFPPLHLIADTWETGSAFPRKCGIFCIFLRFWKSIHLKQVLASPIPIPTNSSAFFAKSSCVLLTPVAYSSSPSPWPSSAFLSSSSPPNKITCEDKKVCIKLFSRLRNWTV